MTLFQHTLKPLLLGQKTETSRLALPEADGEHIIGREMIQYPSGIKSVMQGANMRWSPKWQVGKDYAIQPARGVKAVGRYRIENIWKQDVRTLTEEQIVAEGYGKARSDFMKIWTWMHDRKMHPDSWSAYHLDGRPNELYTAWRMSISVLWESIDWTAPVVAALHIPERESQ